MTIYNVKSSLEGFTLSVPEGILSSNKFEEEYEHPDRGHPRDALIRPIAVKREPYCDIKVRST